MSDQKVRVNRARRAAARRGLQVQKCRRRDPGSLGYGLYRVVDAVTGRVIAGKTRRLDYAMTLGEVEDYLGLEGGDDRRQRTDDAADH